MAKPGVVVESDPTVVAAKASELKKEFQRLVKSIVDDEDCSTQTIDRAKEVLSMLKDLKLRKRSSPSSSPSSQSSSSLSLKLHKNPITCPEEFKCPLSKELMRDPVIVASGQVSVAIWIGLCLVSDKMLEKIHNLVPMRFNS